MAVGSAANDSSSASTNTIGSDDLVNLEQSVDPAYRPGAQWMMHPATLAHLRTRKDKECRMLFPGLARRGDADQPDRCRLKLMRLALKTVNDELARRGHAAVLAKADGYFYFTTGDTDDWLDRTVRVRTINSLTLKEWIEEFRRLKDLNERILRTAKSGRTAAQAQADRRKKS